MNFDKIKEWIVWLILCYLVGSGIGHNIVMLLKFLKG